MNIRNKLIIFSLLIACDSNTETIEQKKQIDTETKNELCSELKQIFCDKLFRCEGVSIDQCSAIASFDMRCENSSASIEQLLLCKDLLSISGCEERVPEYCEELQGT